MGQHWRAKYQAKSREMYFDTFAFDSCRYLYNRLPMINLYGEEWHRWRERLMSGALWTQ